MIILLNKKEQQRKLKKMEFTLGSLEFGGFCLSSFIFYNTLKRQQKLLNSLDFMQNATVFSPMLLKKVMNESGPQSYLKSIKNYTEGKDYSMGSVFIKGYVDCNRPLKSSLNKETKMIISNISTESIFSNNNKLNEGDGIIETRYVNEFKLRGIKSEGFVSVVNNLTVDFNKALNFIDSATHVRSLTGLEKFLSWALFCVKLFLSMSNVGKRLSGFRVGSRKIERGVLLGQFLVVYGKVFYDRMNKELRIDNPKFYLDNKYQLIKRIRSLSIKASRNMALMAFLMALSGFMFLKRVNRNIRKYIMEKKKLKEMRKLDKLYRVSELMTDNFKCMMCEKLARNVIFKPCLHMAVCSLCFEKEMEESKRCLTCGRGVTDKVIIYVS